MQEIYWIFQSWWQMSYKPKEDFLWEYLTIFLFIFDLSVLISMLNVEDWKGNNKKTRKLYKILHYIVLLMMGHQPANFWDQGMICGFLKGFIGRKYRPVTFLPFKTYRSFHNSDKVKLYP